MKKLDKLTLFEIEELAEFQDHIGAVIGDMNEYEEYVPKNKKKKYKKCYDTLYEIWEEIENSIEDISARLAKIYKIQNIDQKKQQLKEKEALSADPAFWNDSNNAKSVSKEIDSLKTDIDKIYSYDVDFDKKNKMLTIADGTTVKAYEFIE